MKCKNCGGNYKTIELKCPFCETENLLGKIWMKERSEAEREYEQKRKDMGKSVLSPYLFNRIANRGLFVLTCLYVGYFVGVVIVALVMTGIPQLSLAINKDKVEAQMEEYYQAGELDELYEYMYDKEVAFSDYYTYAQATLLHYDYKQYLEHRFFFEEMTEEEKKEDDYHLEYAIKEAIEVYMLDCGNYSELDEENRKLYEQYQQEIMAYWIGTLRLTKEEMEEVVNLDYISYDDYDELENKVRIRRGL